MAIYPTKTSKLNYRKSKIRIGTTLISVFSILLLLVSFNFFEIITITILGTFGLLFYPLCLFFIVLGILFVCNRQIQVSKSLVLILTLWLIVFVLILQLATSKSLDLGFLSYIKTTFKENLTAGGVIFATLLYPFYALTYTVATYIILSIFLVIISAFLIDKIRTEIILKKNTLQVTDSNISEVTESYDEVEDDEEFAYLSSSNEVKDQQFGSEDDIFISDEEESEQREEAREILGLGRKSSEIPNNNGTSRDTEIENTSIQQSQVRTIESLDNIKANASKPNIIVHEDTLDTSSNVIKTSEVKISNVKTDNDLKEETRKKAALDYLNINKGNFNAKKLPKGIDNVSSENNNIDTQNNTNNLIQQSNDNADRLSRLNNLTSKLGQIDTNKNQEMPAGVNPFKSRENQDIYDENLTKKTFEQNRLNVNFNTSSESFAPQKAQEVYSGSVTENIVDPKGFRPVQVSMVEPVVKPKPTQKLYKKPPVYVKPPIDLLKKFPTTIDSDNDYMMKKGEMIVETLKSFKLDAKIINAVKGPTFTRYELQMAPGIPVNAVNGKINDLAMVLESSCRIQIPILGKNAFGIEVPNKDRVTVGLREILESSNFQNSKSPLTFALGKNISGECKVAAIDQLVHTLVAGSTGSGKSVCLNAMLLSLLYKASPDELKIILVDPKTVEFTPFNNLPHMLIPNSIVDCDKAVMALNWLVEEMERRYKKLSAIQVRNIDEYNDSAEVVSGSIPKMFYIVMIFDEVGDFMTIAKKEIEEKVMRLAAKSRACGIHLVLATQRPTVDVITGTIKANLPSRIAFAVNSYQDSKTILESSGAESLLGMGDMLFLPKGSNDLNRIQGCYVSGNELKEVIKFIKENNECEFDEEIEDQMFNKKDGFDPTNGAEEAFDPMLKDCLRFFIKAKKVSASSLQANFGIGYPKANKIVMQMEKAGFVSPGDSNSRRTLYITPQEFAERFGEEIDE